MNVSALTAMPLFQGCTEEEIGRMLKFLGFRVRSFSRGDTVLAAGVPETAIGVVLFGSVRIENSDIWGNRTILTVAGAGDLFAEAYACVPGEPLMVTVVAGTDCQVLFVETGRLFDVPEEERELHFRLMGNLLRVCARKNLVLSRRMFHTSSKTIRGRVMSYLSEQVSLQGSSHITIPFDRQQMADYLGVERSALSKELGKMKREGLLDCHKNRFHVRTDG